MQKFKVVSLSLKSTHYDTLLPHDNFSIFYLNIISSVCKTARVKKSQGYYFFFRLFHSSFQDIKSLSDCGPDVPQVLLAVNSTCVQVVILRS